MGDPLPANIVTAGDQMRIIEDLNGPGMPSASEAAVRPSPSPVMRGQNPGSNLLLGTIPLSSPLSPSGYSAFQTGNSLAAFQNIMAPSSSRNIFPPLSWNGLNSVAASLTTPSALGMQLQNGQSGHEASAAPAPIYPMTSLEARAQGMPGRAALARHSAQPVITATPLGSGSKTTAYEGAFAKVAPAAPTFSFQAPPATAISQHTGLRASFQTVHPAVQSLVGNSTAPEQAGRDTVSNHTAQLTDNVRRAASLGSVLTKASMVLSAQQRHQQQQQQRLQQQNLGSAIQQMTSHTGGHGHSGLGSAFPQIPSDALPTVAEISRFGLGTMLQAGFASAANARSLEQTATSAAGNFMPGQVVTGVHSAQALALHQPNASSAASSEPASAPLEHLADQARQASMGPAARTAQEQLLNSTREYRRQQAIFTQPRHQSSQVHALCLLIWSSCSVCKCIGTLSATLQAAS